MNITLILRTILFVSFSFFLISCGSEEEIPETKLLPTFYDLIINFSQTEQEMGVVNILPNNLVCRKTCTSNIASNSVINLIASPKEGAVFVEWTGDCSGNTVCQVTMLSAQTVTASFSKESSVVALTLKTSDSGSITLADNLGECLTDCELSFIRDKKITLNATPDTGYIFTGWTGSCSGNSTCQIIMSESLIVTASFEKESSYILSTEVSIGGSISLLASTLECLDSCKFNLVESTIVNIIAIPDYGYRFKNWLQDCTGTEQCQITIDGTHAIIAIFEAMPTFELITSISLGGSISLKNGSITCAAGKDCSFSILENETVNVIPLPAAGYVFTGWNGDCSGISTCDLIMSAEHSFTATFIEIPTGQLLTLQVTKGGSIALADNLGECFIDCQLSFSVNETLTATATPETGYTFTGWSGDCIGNTICQVTMSAAHSITATFTEIPIFSLTASISVGGSISLKDGSLTCAAGEDCSFTILADETVVVNALPDIGYAFSGWSGDCSGISTCDLTISAEHNFIATFTEIPIFPLTASISVGGSVSLKNGSLTCASGEDCSFSIVENETIIVKALPAIGYAFSGWSGDCSGISTCDLTMSTKHNFIATFIEVPTGQLLTLKMTKGGSIALTDNLGECFIDCQLSFSGNETLTALTTPDAGYTFTGWSGDCTGNTTCQVTMSEARSITATFTEIPTETTLSVIVDTGGSITLSDNLGNCANGCELTFTLQELITLTATPEVGYVFDRWTGDCGGDASCLVNMVSNQTVTASFKPTSHTCTAQASLPADSFDADSEFSYHNPVHDGFKSETLLTDFIVKESSGKGATNYPVSMVFPVEQGLYFHPGDFHIKNSLGEVIPAQFNVINRWWAKDRSLRHIQAHFNVDVEPYILGQATTGIQTFNLYVGNGNIKPNYSVCATESNTEILLDNGLVDIKITKSPLTITTPAGQLKSLFIKENGDSDYSFDHSNIKIELEEIGFLRTIVKISSLTNYVSPTDIKHGWAIRLYMYANTDKVKVDFQLQNSALNTVFSAPLYFDSHQLILDSTGSTTVQVVKADAIDGNKISSGLSGEISAPKVNVFFRDFWQKFPQGLSATTGGNLSIELWPAWSKQFLDDDFAEADLYWLDDMKQTYKEVLLDFSTQNTADYLDTVARNFQYSPVASLPQEYYAKTRVTLELGGYFPTTTVPTEVERIPRYSTEDFTTVDYTGIIKFGHDNFGLDKDRKRATNQTGGTPYSQRVFLISGNPKDYYNAQDMAKAEINIRPQWLSGYTHDENFSSLKVTANPYGGSSWRSYTGAPTSSRDYIAGSSQVATPRDDQHAWFYHVEHAYLMSGNKWLKDWYQFMAEFKQAYLQELDPWPDRSNRAEGHNLSVAMSAYKFVNNNALGQLLKNHTVDYHSKYLLPPHNISIGELNKVEPKGAVFQQGFLLKPFIDIFYEFPEQTTTVTLIKNYVDWNYQYAHFSYYKNIINFEVSTSASGTGQTFVDIAMWYAMHSNETKYADHAINFVTIGINGTKAYGQWNEWLGQGQAQMYNYYLQSN